MIPFKDYSSESIIVSFPPSCASFGREMSLRWGPNILYQALWRSPSLFGPQRNTGEVKFVLGSDLNLPWIRGPLHKLGWMAPVVGVLWLLGCNTAHIAEKKYAPERLQSQDLLPVCTILLLPQKHLNNKWSEHSHMVCINAICSPGSFLSEERNGKNGKSSKITN